MSLCEIVSNQVSRTTYYDATNYQPPGPDKNNIVVVLNNKNYCPSNINVLATNYNIILYNHSFFSVRKINLK